MMTKTDNLINGYILPHPPVIVPEVGNGREQDAADTLEAMKRVAKEIADDRPATIIISSPHAPCFHDFVYLADASVLAGDFLSFGCSDITLSFQNNLELVSAIEEKAKSAGIAAGCLTETGKKRYGISDRLDHGAMVPLYFIEKEWNRFRLVLISTPFLPLNELYEFGRCIRSAVEESNERIVFVASGDLSHRLTRDAPAGYHPIGKEYDDYLIEKLKEGDAKGLTGTEEEFLEKAGECGTRSFIMLMGALSKENRKAEIYSYEGPFGVGYLVGKIPVAGKEEK